MNRHLQLIGSFFCRFFLSDHLYNYVGGYCDAVQSVGLDNPGSRRDAVIALSYLQGYAECARLASPYQSPQWFSAHLLAGAAGSLRLFLEKHPKATPSSAHQLQRMLDSYVEDLQATGGN